ncbi:MAG: 30S ribosome-binding factor RbfA [Flavobacteriaceae bacterium]
MRQEETARQKKIGSLLQTELAKMLQGTLRKSGVKNLILSITRVHVSVDLSIAKVYISVFPSDQATEIVESLRENHYQIKHDMAVELKNQLRKFPDLNFYHDDALDHIEAIDDALKNPENPIDSIDLLDKRLKK